MKPITGSAIRWLLSIALLYGIYGETGRWTAIAIALLMIGQEAHGFVLGKFIKSRRTVL